MKHTEIPHELDNRKRNPIDNENENRILENGDKIIYATLRRFMNKDTRECYPSITKIKHILKCGQNKIYNSIDRLKKAGFIRVNKKLTESGKWTNIYYFPKSEWDDHFEMFTDAFLDMDLPINVKEYYMDIQKFLYDKESGIGKCSFNNTQLSQQLGLSIPSIKKYNTILIEKGLLKEELTDHYDESGLVVVQKNFDLSGLNQAALWVKAVNEQLIKNTEQLHKHDDDIEEMKKELEELKKWKANKEREDALKRNYTLPDIEFKL